CLYGRGALGRRIGLPLETVLGRSTADFVPPEDHMLNGPAWKELLSGERDSFEVALRIGSTATGWRWCLGSVAIDREVGLIIGTHQETSALREAEERFRRAFEDAGIGMAITGIDGRLMRGHAPLAGMLGRAPGER